MLYPQHWGCLLEEVSGYFFWGTLGQLWCRSRWLWEEGGSVEYPEASGYGRLWTERSGGSQGMFCFPKGVLSQGWYDEQVGSLTC